MSSSGHIGPSTVHPCTTSLFTIQPTFSVTSSNDLVDQVEGGHRSLEQCSQIAANNQMLHLLYFAMMQTLRLSTSLIHNQKEPSVEEK